MSTAANVPAEPSPRRSRFPRLPPRFSLRAMLILIGVPCALLSLWAGYREPFARQRRAIEQIVRAAKLSEEFNEVRLFDRGQLQELHAWDGSFEFTLTPVDTWARHFYPSGHLCDVAMARIGDPFVESITAATADVICHELSQLDGLESLELGFSSLSDRHVRVLSRLPRLASLAVDSPQLTDDAVEHLGRMSALSSLTISSSMLTDRGVRRLADLKPDLRSLDIASDATTGDGVGAFRSLRRLWIEVPRISHAGFRSIGACTTLDQLYVVRSPLTAADASCLAGLENLHILYLHHVDVEEQAWGALFSIGKLVQVELNVTSTLPAGSLEPLRKQPLQSFRLHSGSLAPGATATLAGIRSLRQLVLQGVTLSTEDVASLSDATHLHELSLSQTNVTPNEAAMLRAKLRYTRIDCHP